MPLRTSRVAQPEMRAAAVREEVFEMPELRQVILGIAITQPKRAERANAWNGEKPLVATRLKSFGRISRVCKTWAAEMRSKPDTLRWLLSGSSQQRTTELCKALAISATKLKAYPHTEGGMMCGNLYPMPATFDAVLRDHGGWAGVLARAKKNVLQAMAREKTIQAKRLAEVAESRRKAKAAFKQAVEDARTQLLEEADGEEAATVWLQLSAYTLQKATEDFLETLDRD
jgi:hypothetical protein